MKRFLVLFLAAGFLSQALAQTTPTVAGSAATSKPIGVSEAKELFNYYIDGLGTQAGSETDYFVVTVTRITKTAAKKVDKTSIKAGMNGVSANRTTTTETTSKKVVFYCGILEGEPIGSAEESPPKIVKESEVKKIGVSILPTATTGR